MEAHEWRRKKEWLRTAQLASWIINVFLPKGQSATPQRLLGPEFFRGLEKPMFATKEEWERHKADLKKMARFHQNILRKVKSGEKESRVVKDYNVMVRDRKGRG